MPDPRPVPVGEPPTPEGWTIMGRHWANGVQGWVVLDGPPVEEDGQMVLVPVGGAGQVEGSPLDPHNIGTATRTPAEAAAGVGGAGVRLTREEAKAGVYALSKTYGGNLISGPQHSLYNKLVKIERASAREVGEDG